MPRYSSLAALLIGFAVALINAGPARAQAQDDATLEEITVTGQAPPGAVIGDIPPENSLSQRDIRGYGVGTVADLLGEIALQTTSGQGRGDEGPVILVNGRRISGINEVSDLPTEAILRLDILPEEVALKYGYSADQKVVNVILRRRFAALTAEGSGGRSTEGRNKRARGDATLTSIRENKRLNVALAAQSQGSITEAQRGIIPSTVRPGSDPAYRTLQPDRRNYSANVVFAAPLTNSVSASTNLTATYTDSRSLNGLAASALAGQGSAQAILEPLDQRAQSTTLHLGTSLNADLPNSWRLSFTGAYDHANSHTDTERASPAAVLLGLDEARSVSDAADASVLATRKLFRLPAGDMLLSLQGGLHTSRIRSEATGIRPRPARTLSRSSGNAQVSLDLPVTRKNAWGGAIGSLTANVTTSAVRISDFDTLKTFGYGLNWSPVSSVSVIAGISEDRRAPTVQQLISPEVTLANASVYDYATGETVLVTSTTGGNPLLLADYRRTFKLGATIKPFSAHDFTLTGNYTDTRTRNGILAVPGVSPSIEAAFPDRFVRDEDGELVSYDVRPVNVAAQDRSSLRWGFNLTQVLREPRRPEFVDRPRPAQRQPAARTPADTASPLAGPVAESSDNASTAAAPAQRPQNETRPSFANRRAGRPAGGFGGRRAGPLVGGDDGARLQLSVYHTWLFRNEVTLRSGLTPIDLLGGGTLGGPPPSRHLVQINGGVTDNGMGIRLTGQWRSAENVVDLTSGAGDVRFGSLATLDLRFFADLGLRYPRHEWARGLRTTLAVQNIFDQRQNVNNDSGAVPRAYQAGYLDPAGRVVLLTVRKIL